MFSKQTEKSAANTAITTSKTVITAKKPTTIKKSRMFDVEPKAIKNIRHK